MEKDNYEYSYNETDHPVKTPESDNDYKDHPEIESPNPSSATPSIPAEMPPR